MFSKRTVALVFGLHAVAIIGIGFFASREGMLGQKMKALTVALVPKEKPPVVEKPKVEQPKVEVPQPITPKQEIVQQTAPPPKTESVAPPVVVPPASELPSIQFNDGAKDVLTTSDPIQLYKSQIEFSLRSQWKRPENLHDENYVAMVEITVDNKGKIVDNKWLSGSGDSIWDSSVKKVFTEVRSISRPPPKGFPNTFQVKFDTANE